MLKKCLRTPLSRTYSNATSGTPKNKKTSHHNNPILSHRYSTRSQVDKVFENGQVLDTIKYMNTFIYVAKGDLTTEDTDAIVNAANSYLAHGGGVAGAIVRRGGREIQKGSDEIVKTRGQIPTGSAVEQFAPVSMKCRYIIHAVGPIYDDGKHDEERLLSSCIEKSLEIADTLDPPVSSISFPAISSGIFGFPKDLCAEVFFFSILNYLKNNENTKVKHIRLTNFDDPTVNVFRDEIKKVKHYLEEHNKENKAQ